jgi:DNA polymerase-3 subunit epsilon
LGKLCNSLNIPLEHRHRAGGDAHATALLFKQILNNPQGPETINSFLKVRSKEATLPPHLPKSLFDQLPEAPGIYFFKNEQGKIIYIGKAINLKKRVLGHFYDSAHKERQLCMETATIDFELSGSELLALLMETNAIKQHFPPYNKAQKNFRPTFGLFSYQDRDGIMHLATTRLRKGQQSSRTFLNEAEARLYLEELCEEFQLCAKYCHLQQGVDVCSHFRVPKCKGVCAGTEPSPAYNFRVKQALIASQPKFGDHVIFQEGRTLDEQGLIWISNGQCKGFGFVPTNFHPENSLDLESKIPVQARYPESDRLLDSYIAKHPEQLIPINDWC